MKEVEKIALRMILGEYIELHGKSINVNIFEYKKGKWNGKIRNEKVNVSKMYKELGK